jgi:hypothetical protein
MTKTEHLQFLVLMIPTFLILVAAAVSMADIALPAPQETYAVAAADPMAPADQVWDDRPAQSQR